jgi:hypothetical protein
MNTLNKARNRARGPFFAGAFTMQATFSAPNMEGPAGFGGVARRTDW